MIFQILLVGCINIAFATNVPMVVPNLPPDSQSDLHKDNVGLANTISLNQQDVKSDVLKSIVDKTAALPRDGRQLTSNYYTNYGYNPNNGYNRPVYPINAYNAYNNPPMYNQRYYNQYQQQISRQGEFPFVPRPTRARRTTTTTTRRPTKKRFRPGMVFFR